MDEQLQILKEIKESLLKLTPDDNTANYKILVATDRLNKLEALIQVLESNMNGRFNVQNEILNSIKKEVENIYGDTEILKSFRSEEVGRNASLGVTIGYIIAAALVIIPFLLGKITL